MVEKMRVNRTLSPEEVEDFIMWGLEAMGIRTYKMTAD
jgi:hypothetical protein